MGKSRSHAQRAQSGRPAEAEPLAELAAAAAAAAKAGAAAEAAESRKRRSQSREASLSSSGWQQATPPLELTASTQQALPLTRRSSRRPAPTPVS
jgi:hypothetical protein